MRQYRKYRKDLPVSEAFWAWLIKALAMPALLATPARAPGRTPLPASRLDKAACERLAAFNLKTDNADRLRVSGGRHLPDLLRRRLAEAAALPDGVLYPRCIADVEALLRLCAELDIAVAPAFGDDAAAAGHKAVVALDLTSLNRILTQDPVAGRMEVEAGITAAELERLLAPQGLSLGQKFDGDLGGWIGSCHALPSAVESVKVATPQGVLHLESGLKHVLAASRARLGIITAATLRVTPVSDGEECCAYLFHDFAAGLAVLRQAARAGIALGPVFLSDDGATCFERAMQRRPWNLGQRLFDAWLVLREFDNGVARLVVSFPGGKDQRKLARQSFEALAKRLGALRLGKTQMPDPYPRDALLDHGVGIDALQFSASWSELPLRYARARAALKQAMRTYAPLTGAHGLVLAHVGDVRSDGASLTVNWLFPRKLEEEVAQAAAIRQAALAAAGIKSPQELELEMRRALKRTLDPKEILPPEN